MFVIARYAEGNKNLIYLMCANSDIKKFNTSDDAKDFLKEHGVPQVCIDEGDYVITPIDSINQKSAA